MSASPINEKESFLIQAHALLECIANLGNLEASGDEAFRSLSPKIYGQTANSIRNGNENYSVFQSQGTFLTVFYMLLVLPREWMNRGTNEFASLDFTAAEGIANVNIRVITNTYKESRSPLKHFRDALAHGRIGWQNDCFVFENEIPNDKGQKDKGQKFRATLSMDGAGKLAQSLSKMVAEYIKNVIAKRPQEQQA